MAKALFVISDAAPALIEIQQQALLRAGPDAWAPGVLRRLDMLADLNLLHAATQRLREDRFFVPSGRKKREALWHRDAIWLWFHFDGLTRKHGKEISFTKEEGLGTKLIQTALGRAGTAITLSAVAQAISRLKGKPLRVINLPDNQWVGQTSK